MADIQTSRTAQALGRIIGSLCVVTFEHHSHHRAILTARISQASFSPPGIMMALPMGDDAISSLQTQASFVLNILKEGRSIRRHFSYQKSCQIAVDQLNTEILQGGKPIFTDALAYLEGTIVSQQIMGSHLLVYAHISNGQVLDQGGLTAIHHQKTFIHER